MQTETLPAKANDLLDDIKQAYDDTLRLASEGARNVKASIDSAIRCGGFLCRLKHDVGHGNFGPILKQYSPVGEDTAERWMKLSKSAHERNLTDCPSLRQALIACGIISERPKKPHGSAEIILSEVVTKRAITKIHSCYSLLSHASALEMPEPNRMALLDELRPLVELYTDLLDKTPKALAVSSEVVGEEVSLSI